MSEMDDAAFARMLQQQLLDEEAALMEQAQAQRRSQDAEQAGRSPHYYQDHHDPYHYSQAQAQAQAQAQSYTHMQPQTQTHAQIQPNQMQMQQNYTTAPSRSTQYHPHQQPQHMGSHDQAFQHHHPMRNEGIPPQHPSASSPYHNASTTGQHYGDGFGNRNDYHPQIPATQHAPNGQSAGYHSVHHNAAHNTTGAGMLRPAENTHRMYQQHSVYPPDSGVAALPVEEDPDLALARRMQELETLGLGNMNSMVIPEDIPGNHTRTRPAHNTGSAISRVQQEEEDARLARLMSETGSSLRDIHGHDPGRQHPHQHQQMYVPTPQGVNAPPGNMGLGSSPFHANTQASMDRSHLSSNLHAIHETQNIQMPPESFSRSPPYQDQASSLGPDRQVMDSALIPTPPIVQRQHSNPSTSRERDSVEIPPQIMRSTSDFSTHSTLSESQRTYTAEAQTRMGAAQQQYIADPSNGRAQTLSRSFDEPLDSPSGELDTSSVGGSKKKKDKKGKDGKEKKKRGLFNKFTRLATSKGDQSGNSGSSSTKANADTGTSGGGRMFGLGRKDRGANSSTINAGAVTAELQQQQQQLRPPLTNNQPEVGITSGNNASNIPQQSDAFPLPEPVVRPNDTIGALPGPVPYSLAVSRDAPVLLEATVSRRQHNPLRSGGTCAVCQKSIQNPLNALDKKYHRECFRCLSCQKLIDANCPFAYAETNGDKQPMHRNCYAEIYGIKCAVCRNAIPSGPDGKVSFVKHPFFDTEQMCPRHAKSVTRRCTGCHRFEPETEPFVDLSDLGRCVCLACCRSVVVDSVDAQPLWEKVISFFEAKLNLPIWKDFREVPILVVGYNALNDQMMNTDNVHGGASQIMTRGLCLTEHESGKKFKTNRMQFDKIDMSFRAADAEARGFTYFQVPDANKVNPDASVTAILCLSGLPRDLVASVLAHEATHAWIKLHPRFDILKPISPQVEEGCAQLIALLFLNEGLDPAPPLANNDGSGPSDEKLRQYFRFSIETDDHDIYGTGYRRAAMAYSKIGMEALMSHVVLYQDFPEV